MATLTFAPADALAASGTGTQPYGDLPYTLVAQIKERFLADDENGTPLINSFVKDALSKGSDGIVHLGDLVNWNTTVVAAGLEAFVGVRVFDALVLETWIVLVLHWKLWTQLPEREII